MRRWLPLLILAIALPSLGHADEWPAELPPEGTCTVCARRGAAHGAERYVGWREHDGEYFGFCSDSCSEAFDQMPLGYTVPVLPRPAPTFHWSTLDGEEIQQTGQPALLVDFWATWCGPCKKSMPGLEQLAAEFAGDGLRVVGVSIDEERATLDSYLKRNPLAYSVVHDGGDDPAWWQFRVPAIPAAYLLNGDGEIVAQWSGEFEVSELRTELEALGLAE